MRQMVMAEEHSGEDSVVRARAVVLTNPCSVYVVVLVAAVED